VDVYAAYDKSDERPEVIEKRLKVTALSSFPPSFSSLLFFLYLFLKCAVTSRRV
jgi:hypothetical protein